MIEQKSLYKEIKVFNILGSFSEILIISNFLKTGKKWALNQYKNWINIIDGADKEYNFLETIKKYCLAVKKYV